MPGEYASMVLVSFLRKLTCTSEAIPSITFFTQATIRTHCVLAVSMWTAHVGSIRALIQIFKIIRRKRFFFLIKKQPTKHEYTL